MSIFALAGLATALYDAGTHSGIDGWPKIATSLGQLVVKHELKQRHRDGSALDEMATLARSRVPIDTGLLLSGIETEQTDAYCEFRASAVHEDRSGGEDYARFVEFGTAAGTRGAASVSVASGDFFGTAVGPSRRRRAYRTHPGTPARPYFYSSAREVLERRGDDAAADMNQTISEEGLE